MYNFRDAAWLTNDSSDHWVVSIDLTARRIFLFVVGITLALVFIIWHPVLSDTPLVRPMLATFYLTFVPGFVLSRLLGIDPDNSSALVVYSVGLSLFSVMALGATVNFGLPYVGVSRPLSELPLVTTLSIAVLALTTGYYYFRPHDKRKVKANLTYLTSPSILGLAVLPILGIYGALMLTRFNNNIVLIILFVGIAVVPVLLIARLLPVHSATFAIWAIGLALVLQNTLTGNFLTWGDQENEASLVLHILQVGFWDPLQAPHHANMFTMLRIGILHPVYGVFTGLDVVWLFKLIHPLLFSLVPVALYLAYRQYFDERAAFVSVFLYVSLFSFFVVLSRNTRTATAILFLSCFLLALTDDSLTAFQSKILTMFFAASIIVSHYGTSYLVLMGFGLVLILKLIVEQVMHDREIRVSTVPFMFLYGTLGLSWYIFVSPGSKSYRLVINFINHFYESLRSEFLANPEATSATTRYVTGEFSSITIEILRFFNLFIGAVIGIGLLISLWKFYMDDSIEFDTEFFVYAWAFMGVFGFTFLPVERFNTARTYAITLVFFAPFFVVGVRELLRLLEQPSFRRIAVTVTVLFFLLNAGVVSVAVTHEYSPNILVEKNRVMATGNPVEQEYFYKQYLTVHDVSSYTWLRSSAEPDADVFSSSWPGNPRGAVGDRQAEFKPTNPVPLTFRSIPTDSRIDRGYVYLGSFSYLGNIIKFPGDHFVFNWEYTTDEAYKWDHKNKIYDNGGSAVYGP